MLMQGGDAVDALVAAQTVLAVVEPQSSGLGGGGFLLHWNAQQRQLDVLDGREQAPGTSQPDDLLTPDGRPLPWREASSQLRAIGIPGTVALLWDAHQRWGRLPWTTTFQPAIDMARKGFRTTPRLLRSISLAERIGIRHSAGFEQLYRPGGQRPRLNQVFRNPSLGDTLEQIARNGGPTFYDGALAARILKGMAELGSHDQAFQGWSAADLSNYTVIRRRPVCHPIQRWTLCTVPPPSGGGLAILQTLAFLEATGPMSTPKRPRAWKRFATALQWADADRLYWVNDPSDWPVPMRGLLAPHYLRGRAKAMLDQPTSIPGPGLPPGRSHYPFAKTGAGVEQGTTHLSIVDQHGNLAVYTGSVETVFGSRHVVAGMVMNNQLTDFAFEPAIQGRPVANRRRPGKRPMSSMAPLIVFENDQPVLAVGSPGGRTIPHFISRVLMASLFWGLPPEQSVAMPHLSMRGKRMVAERDSPIPWPFTWTALSPGDQQLTTQPLNSGIALLQRIQGRWHGVADPRREGTAMALP
jgi:gamma-glutamyltranspeptidase/glutathione hydrolase